MQCSHTPLGQWLQQNGGQFHPNLIFKSDEFGTSVYATSNLGPGTSTVACPFALAITPASCRTALSSFLSSPALTDHQATCLCLVLHRIDVATIPPAVELRHQVYVDTLPTAFDTPLWWTKAEVELLRGTNLKGAVVDRSKSWKAEWSSLVELLPESLKPQVTWSVPLPAPRNPPNLIPSRSCPLRPLYLWASSIVSSRSFPSSLITGPTTPDPDPVLFPGVDTLNHAYATPITWSSDVKHPTHPSLSLILESQVGEDEQVFNTYGPKANEEWLLGYGFVPEENPSDLLVLALSKPPSSSSDTITPSTLSTTLEMLGLNEIWRHSVPRSGVIPKDLLDQIRWLIAGTWPSSEIGEMRLEEMREGGKDVFLGYEVEYEAIDSLGSMIGSKIEKVVTYEDDYEFVLENVKEERREMARRYRRQLEILQAVDAHLEMLMDKLEERAHKEGYDFTTLGNGDEDDIDEEEETNNEE
ncbi:BZ3500_MvSof-1268-A1-R1_Chr6-3g08744 [Microbotryum saponariae]|uniref:BZ3500_MvSof-1268-A1-R1_Chr6-3g08744 protein n=1 Tax=Microbotryum saponariae TaxID=289078 RepID=A0A2X0KNL2_9BASI|nr:BZ3500_MvSof-1268-A1-R1_Chr6-3g08744 [Microbotryum saponariae]SDA07345.1 BZ3501_MvSof-1269-A2-R1_Chr6-2g08447 [Microbotryum saponariae]